MNKLIIIVLINSILILGLVNCSRTNKEEINSKQINNCLSEWVIKTNENYFVISRKNKIHIKKDICQKCPNLLLTDSLNRNIFILYDKNLFLVDCDSDTVYEHNIKTEKLPILEIRIDRINNYYIYSNKAEFYLFDDKLSLLYSSWDYVSHLPDNELLGLSGLNIGYIKTLNKIILSYELLTDVPPYLLNTLNDTLFIN